MKRFSFRKILYLPKKKNCEKKYPEESFFFFSFQNISEFVWVRKTTSSIRGAYWFEFCWRRRRCAQLSPLSLHFFFLITQLLFIFSSTTILCCFCFVYIAEKHSPLVLLDENWFFCFYEKSRVIRNFKKIFL